jgi:hypothetical protein
MSKGGGDIRKICNLSRNPCNLTKLRSGLFALRDTADVVDEIYVIDTEEDVLHIHLITVEIGIVRRRSNKFREKDRISEFV